MVEINEYKAFQMMPYFYGVTDLLELKSSCVDKNYDCVGEQLYAQMMGWA